MRASTAPKHNHSRPTFAPTSVGTSLAFEFMARSLEIKSERPLVRVRIRVLTIVPQLRTALSACRGHRGGGCAVASPRVRRGGKAA